MGTQLKIASKNNWVRIVGVKRIDKRRMEKPREEGCVKESFRKKLVRSWLKWAGYIERMEGVQLTKRTDVLRVEVRMRKSRLR